MTSLVSRFVFRVFESVYLSKHRLSTAELKLMSFEKDVNEVTLPRAHPSIFVFQAGFKNSVFYNIEYL